MIYNRFFIGAVCRGEPGCCTNSDPCEIGEGDCDDYYDCKGGLYCGTNNCNRDVYPQFTEQDDCCY